MRYGALLVVFVAFSSCVTRNYYYYSTPAKEEKKGDPSERTVMPWTGHKIDPSIYLSVHRDDTNKSGLYRYHITREEIDSHLSDTSIPFKAHYTH